MLRATLSAKLLFAAASLLLAGASTAHASGPHWIAGVSYFDPAAKGLPVAWAGGKVSYYIDQGNLSSLLTRAQTAAMLTKAANVWTAVPTAAISIGYSGGLSEDVSGSNVTAGANAGTAATLPVDVQPGATSKPLGIIMDTDGSVIDAMYGTGASVPVNCTQNGIFVQVDNMATAGTIVHGLMILNGRCATTTAQVALLQYEMVRAFGRLLGLDWSQVNDALIAGTGETSNAMAGWPVMHPAEIRCGNPANACMANPLVLRLDDIAGLNRLYPVTSANIGAFTGKQITAQATLLVQGTIRFKRGQGMQGVNVVLTPMVAGSPQVQYAVSVVSGARFHGNVGNAVSGAVDAQGNRFDRFGTDDAAMEGFFDLSGVPLPAGKTVADYQLTFEPVNPAYVNESANGPYVAQYSVGPYGSAQITPSGVLPVVNLLQLAAGTAITQDVTFAGSGDETHTDDGTEEAPNRLTVNGEWVGRLSGYGHTGWYVFEARAHRQFTVEGVAHDETGLASVRKTELVLGMWNGADAIGSSPDLASPQPRNGAVAGLTTLSAQTNAAGLVRLAFADMRGDGRPDFLYSGRVLYADRVIPARLALAGGPIAIEGRGFRPGLLVLVNGAQAAVTSVSPTEITATAPAASGAIGMVTVTVTDPVTLGLASILDGLSYDAYGSDQIGLVSGPSGVVSQDVPVPLTVRVLGADNLTPAANVTVTFAVQQGSANLGCGAAACGMITNGAGLATVLLSPTSSQTTRVVASLSNGASVAAEFNGSSAPSTVAVSPTLYLAIGAQVRWQPTALILRAGVPVPGASVQWSALSAGLSVASSASTTNSAGLASTIVMAGPLVAGQTASLAACQAPSSCTQFTSQAVHGELALLVGISGAGQNLASSAVPAPVVLEATDAVGHPLAGATVNFYETLSAWQPVCPAQGNCPARQTLGTRAVSTVSDAQGMVMLTPLTGNGQATTLVVSASTGQQASLVFSIVQYPCGESSQATCTSMLGNHLPARRGK